MNPEIPGIPPQPPRTCPFAIVSLIVGITSFCLPILGSITAIVFGAVALSRIKSSSGALTGRAMAIVGIVLGCISLVVGPLVFLAFWALVAHAPQPMHGGPL